MKIIIQSLGFKASSQLEDFVQEKLNKIAEHADNIIKADVILFKGPESDPQNCHCEVRLDMPGNDPFVKKSASGFEEAVVGVTDTLDHIVQKNKEKQISARKAMH